MSKDVRHGAASTLDADSLFLMFDGSGLSVKDGGVNTGRVTQADVPASNGVVHVIDEVLVPLSLVASLLGMPSALRAAPSVCHCPWVLGVP